MVSNVNQKLVQLCLTTYKLVRALRSTSCKPNSGVRNPYSYNEVRRCWSCVLQSYLLPFTGFMTYCMTLQESGWKKSKLFCYEKDREAAFRWLKLDLQSLQWLFVAFDAQSKTIQLLLLFLKVSHPHLIAERKRGKPHVIQFHSIFIFQFVQ